MRWMGWVTSPLRWWTGSPASRTHQVNLATRAAARAELDLTNCPRHTQDAIIVELLIVVGHSLAAVPPDHIEGERNGLVPDSSVAQRWRQDL